MDKQVLKNCHSKKSKSNRHKSRFLFLWPVYFLFLFLYLNKAQVHAQPKQNPSIFENIKLSPNFSPDPQIIKGISGGQIPAKKISGRTETANGPCVGFLDKQPNHKIQLTAFFDKLSLVVESPEDTSLVISGPGGTWCNDDYQGKNPGISGQWLPGTYKIWVASYDKAKFSPYMIRISQIK